MQLRFRTIALATALATGAGSVAAQDFVFGWNPRSGDVWVDTRLDDINDYGYRYREPFINEMVDYRGAPRDLVTDLLVQQRWAPGDIYYACTLAQVIGQPCGYVVDRWEQNHGQGWGVVAQRMGIKPGSPEFHQLKKGFVPTYDRWGRPIRIDETLRIDFPDRGRGPDGIAVFDKPGKSGYGKANGKGSSGKGNSGKGNSGKGNSGNGSSGKGNSGKSDSGQPDKGNQGKSQGGGGNKQSGGNGNNKGKGGGKGKNSG